VIEIPVQTLRPTFSPESSPRSSPESRVQVLYCPTHRRKHRTSCMINSSYLMYSQFISSPNWRHNIENNSNRPQVHLGIILFSKYNFRCLLVWNQHNIGYPIMGNFPSMVYRTWGRLNWSLLTWVPYTIVRIFYTTSHRLQLFRNLRDSPGFLEFVPDPGTLRKLSRKSA